MPGEKGATLSIQAFRRYAPPRPTHHVPLRRDSDFGVLTSGFEKKHSQIKGKEIASFSEEAAGRCEKAWREAGTQQ